MTKQKFKIEIPGRVIYNGTEIFYRRGCIGSDDFSEELLEKLREIATVFGADLYDCGEMIE